jgi:hypothetical protein
MNPGRCPSSPAGSLRAGLAAVVLAAGALPAWAAPTGVFHVQEVQFIDTQGFGKPLVARTMMVPAGWRHQARVEWFKGLHRCGLPFKLEMQAESQDGLSAITLAPYQIWGMASPAVDDGCQRANFTTAEQYLRDWVRRHRPGAIWLDYRIRPERSVPVSEAGDASLRMRQWTETGQALVGYQVKGRAVRESLAVTIAFSGIQTQMAGMRSQSLYGETKGLLAWRAPEGQLDFEKFDVMWGSMAPGYEWSALVKQGLDKIAADNRRTAAAISGIMAQTSMDTLRHMAQRGEDARRTREQIHATWNAGVAARDSADDRLHRERIRAVREVEHYVDPSRPSGVAELPNHYRHAWSLKDGNYALTNDPNFDPRRDLGTEGRLLRPAPR